MRKLIFLIFVFCVCISADNKYYSKIPKDFVLIPMGSCYVKDKTISVSAFVMKETEVSNKEYREFLNDLLANKEFEKYKIALPDTAKWRMADAYCEPYVQYYFRHPAYDNYPAVNISREAALIYCDWLSEKMEKEHGRKIEVRLPTEFEWVYAAKGGSNDPFPWEGDSMKDKKGCDMCCYKHIEQYNIRKSASGNIEILNEKLSAELKGSMITTPVRSYFPNLYGLYNMSGNAAEMTADEGIIKGGSWNSTGYYMMIESESEYSEKDIPSAFVGFRVCYDYMPVEKK